MEESANTKSRISGRTNANHCYRLLQLVFLLDTLPPEKRNNTALVSAMQISRPAFFRVLNDLRQVMQMDIPYVSQRLKGLEDDGKKLYGYYYIKSQGIINVEKVRSLFAHSSETVFSENAEETLQYVNEALAQYGMKSVR